MKVTKHRVNVTACILYSVFDCPSYVPQPGMVISSQVFYPEMFPQLLTYRPACTVC